MKNEYLLSEDNYIKEMNETVSPYLNQRKTEVYPEREAGKPIFCARYTADSPKGIVLISHGFTESAEKYREAAYYFTKLGYHTCVIEHCGHGRSYRLTEDLSLVHIDRFERYVEDLLFVSRSARDAFPGLPLYLYGHSMGGGIAAAAAATAPGMFQKLLLSSPMIRPATGNIPWAAACLLASAFCLVGKGTEYVMGQHPYDGLETFQDSASLSEQRFSYYQNIKKAEPLFQTSAASYRWMREAARMSRFLATKAWKQIQSPALVFQAGQDDFVSGTQQKLFVEKINRSGQGRSSGRNAAPTARLIRMPDSKHEIYNSEKPALEVYWEEIFTFLQQDL